MQKPLSNEQRFILYRYEIDDTDGSNNICQCLDLDNVHFLETYLYAGCIEWRICKRQTGKDPIVLFDSWNAMYGNNDVAFMDGLIFAKKNDFII
ncbi:hypothetical protein [Lonepinella sp. BR2882]|uniref:hypothetical protein n=1 Tax=Lonepinella sp. BR2882 TaxID=3095283 RepID=UPI003F6E2C28